MRFMVIVGMPAAGKNIAHDFAIAHGYAYYATGDIVRAEAKKQGLTPDAESMAALSQELRGTDGMGVTRLALATAMQNEKSPVFLEGMRSWPEIELIRQHGQATVVAFLAPRGVRRERMAARGRSDDAPDAFDARDQRELAYGTAIPVALADAYVLNTGTIEDAMRQIETIVAAGD